MQIRVYVDAFFMTLYFSCYVTATQTLTFGYAKCTPDVATGSYLDIVFGQYVRQGMGENFHQKCGMSSPLLFFAHQYHPWCHVRFVKNERLECEIKVSLGYDYKFYRHNTNILY